MSAARTLGETIVADITRAAELVAAGQRRTGRTFADMLGGDFDPVQEFRQQARRQSAAHEVNVAQHDEPFGWPVPGARVSSVFGDRFHPVDKEMKLHAGIDLAAPAGTPVRATAPGRVTFAGSRGGYGLTVEIRHGSGHLTRYAHLSEIDVAAGAEVARGVAIGKVGATGKVTGAHLHYEIRKDGAPVDPATYMAMRR